MRRLNCRTVEEVAAALAAKQRLGKEQEAHNPQLELLLKLERSRFVDYHEQYPLVMPGPRRLTLVEPK